MVYLCISADYFERKMLMQALNLPEVSLNIQNRSGKTCVFDIFRKRFVVLTPEEWVRQRFLRFLCDYKKYPVGLIAVEASLQYNRLAKRADAIVYGTIGKPLMIIECKAPDVKITQEVFDQVARYNFSFGVDYLTVTNGIQHYCVKRNAEASIWEAQGDIPSFNNINAGHALQSTQKASSPHGDEKP